MSWELISTQMFSFYFLLEIFFFVFIWDKLETRPWNDRIEKSGTLSGLDENVSQSTFVPIVRNSSSGTQLMEDSCMQEKIVI